MAECIIARGGGRSDDSFQPPIIADKHTILVTLKTSSGNTVKNALISCKDGDNWYNYTSNDKGQVLFVTNSGAANITAYNYSLSENIKFIDQGYITSDIDAPTGLSTILNLAYTEINYVRFTTMNSNISDLGITNAFTGNYKCIAHNYANVFAGGGGGGGGQSDVYSSGGSTYVLYEGWGGGGGGSAYTSGIDVSNNRIFTVTVGSGGAAAANNQPSASGGSSSCLGVVGNGGSGAFKDEYVGIGGTGIGEISYFGGNGGYQAGNPSNNAWHGGGGGAGDQHDNIHHNGGAPGGGQGGSGNWRDTTNVRGRNGVNGGGGGGAGGGIGSNYISGGRGGAGQVRITFY